MEDNQPQQQPHVHIKGKDLPGAVNVLPAGLGEVLAKRESREFKMERSGNTTTYSTTSGNPGENVQQSFSKDLNSSSFAASSTSSMQQQTSSASFKQQSSFSSSMSSSSSSSSSQMQQKSILKQQQPQQIKEHGEEIEQESLKTTLQSAITDIEDNLEQEASFEQPAADKENVAPVQPEMTVQCPPPAVPQVMAPVEENVPVGVTGSQNGHYMESDFLPAGDDERVRLRQPHEFRGRPQSCPNVEALYTPEQLDLPDPSSPGPKKRSTAKQEQHSMQQSSTSEHMETTTTTTTINGTSQEEQQQMFMNRSLGAGSVTLGQVMTPVQDPDYDSSSLKRRNPREMYTDSAFYSPKFHPSVAEQVEMAHRLSSSLYDDGNKMSKGQEMYLKRAKKSGDVYEPEPDLPHHDKVPNLKLVMNPDGKLHDWTDLPDDEIPELQQMATGGGNPEVAHTVVENLQSCKGKGINLARPTQSNNWIGQPTFAGSFRQVFNSRRGMFEQTGPPDAARVSGQATTHNNHDTQLIQHNQRLSRSRTLPDLVQISGRESPAGQNRPRVAAAATGLQVTKSPVVPKRGSSKHYVAQLNNNRAQEEYYNVGGSESNRRPLRNFFCNS